LIICQPKEQIAEFVSSAVGGSARHFPWGNYSALGLTSSGQLVAGVIYNHYAGPTICAHIGAVPGKKWLTRSFLRAMFDYPFNQLKVRRITGLVPKRNRAARKFDEHLGFKLEGCMRHALPDDDMLVYGMLREECRWL